MMRAALTRGVENTALIRSINTRIDIPRTILRFVVVLVGAALVLMQFEAVRSLGVSLIASAGLAGLVVGLAAQRTIANLLAGIQLAFSQPIKIGDTVIVENEFGWIEEVGLTHVVIKTWDLRRIILPVSHFLEKPF
jgi:small-conductance mechanosensitive channel